jgi:hypothetical protein
MPGALGEIGIEIGTDDIPFTEAITWAGPTAPNGTCAFTNGRGPLGTTSLSGARIPSKLMVTPPNEVR